jgi:DNA polymerase-4
MPPSPEVSGVSRQILHVDMDAFYAAIEERDRPELRGKAVLVGGSSPRAVVCTASYEARKFGARSAMPIAAALRLCPHAIVLSPRMAVYAEVSEEVMAVLRRYSPLVEPLSLDEAFVDVTESRALFGDGTAVAARIRSEIASEVSLTASAGVATSKFVAKVASDLKKPDALVTVPPGGEASFLAPLPVERMWGVGPKAAVGLRRAGYRTIGDLARTDPARLDALLGSWGRTVHELARGVDVREVSPHHDPVSIGAEETFDVDLRTRDEIARALLAQAARVARRLTARRLACRTVVLKLKRSDFKLVTRHASLREPVSDTQSLYQAACSLLDRVDTQGVAFRLAGVAAKELVLEGEAQPGLFPDEAAMRRARLERTLLGVRARFGDGAVIAAELGGSSIGRPPVGRGARRKQV